MHVAPVIIKSFIFYELILFSSPSSDKFHNPLRAIRKKKVFKWKWEWKRKCILSCGRHKLTTNYDVSPRVELTINAHTRITVMLYVSFFLDASYLAEYRLSSITGGRQEDKFFFHRVSHHVNRNTCQLKLCRFEWGFIERLKYKILDIQMRQFLLNFLF